MAYGDGGFFFTQPVGNGYSGLGSFGAASAPATPSTVSLRAPTMSVRTRGGMSLATRGAVTSPCLRAGASCTIADIDAEMARISARWDAQGFSSAQRQQSKSWRTWTALKQLRTKLLARMAQAEAAYAQQEGQQTAEEEVVVRMGPVATSEGQEPMDLIYTDLPPDALEEVSLDIEEPTGVVAWVYENKLLTAGIVGAVCFFGYREADRRGMI